jgi:hypothetical protein
VMIGAAGQAYAMWYPGRRADDGGENRFKGWFAEWKAPGEAQVPPATSP